MTATPTADALELSAYLKANGATPGTALRAALGWDAERFWKAVLQKADEVFLLTTGGWVVKDGPDEPT